MRVEFRRRPAKGAQDPVKRSASASPSLVKAYSDSCFESPTSFYIASPEHPKLGKWAQPSTLKYSLPPQQHTTHNATRCVALFASNHGRPHTTGRNPITRAKNTWKAVSVSESRSKKGPSHQRLKEPERPERPASPVGSLLVGCSNSSPSSSIRGRREAPHIDTPVSGRVAPIHQRSNQTSTLPASPTLCGSFDRQYHPRVRSAGAARATHPPVTFDWSAAAVGPGISSQAPVGYDAGGTGFNDNYTGEPGGDLVRSSYEKEEVDVPDVRYRVTKLDESLLAGKSRNLKGEAARPATDGDDGCTLPPNQAIILPPTFPDSEATRPESANLPDKGENRMAASKSCGEDGSRVGVGDVDPWTSTRFEPFMSDLRQALLRDRPPDVPAYVSTFSKDWRGEYRLQRP